MQHTPMLTARTCRRLRQWLGWSTERLGALAGLNADVVRRFERGEEIGLDRVRAIQDALKDALVTAPPDGPDGPHRRAAASARPGGVRRESRPARRQGGQDAVPQRLAPAGTGFAAAGESRAVGSD